MAIDRSGGVWFIELRAGKIGRYAGGRFAEFPVPGPQAGLTNLAVAPDGSVWFTALREHKLVFFQGQGWIRPVYFTLLTSHTILAVVIVPLILVTRSRSTVTYSCSFARGSSVCFIRSTTDCGRLSPSPLANVTRASNSQ